MTAATDNPWAILDGLIGISGVQRSAEKAGTQSAFYGRCSTEDNQDPKTSRGWQLENAEKFVGPVGGAIVEEFFDIGQSRSVPWDRRPEGSQLLAALKDPAADVERRGGRGGHALLVRQSVLADRSAVRGVRR